MHVCVQDQFRHGVFWKGFERRGVTIPQEGLRMVMHV